ncbi:MAG: hypothetical protein KGZ53_02740 [Peptococcaceae bacterium]|nr:hypothetical protein [Peptococcaceae bacterium]
MNNITLRVDPEMYNAIKIAATRNGLTISEYARRALETGAERAASVAGREEAAAAVRAEMRRALLVTENRIIKILTKAIFASVTDTHLSVQCIATANRRDVTETLKSARAASVTYLQQKDGDDNDGDK